MWMRLGSAVLSTSVMMLGVGGCHSPSGGFMPASFGSSTYYSTETQPKSVTIIDMRSGEEIFHMDIPAGKQLTLDFVSDGGDDPVHTPDLMRYQVWDIGTTTGRLRNSMTVPRASSRRIDVHIRPGVEYVQAPATERLRTDQLEERPDWWTPQGGPMPDDSPAEIYDN